MGCHALLQGIFRTQGPNQVSRIAGGFFPVSATGNPRILSWVIYLLSKESCPPRNEKLRFFCIAGGFFTS